MKSLRRLIRSLLNLPWVRFVVDLFQRFGNDNGALYAAGLAFFLLLSFAPLLLTAVAILGCFINVHMASHKVAELMQSLLPSGGARTEATDFLTVQLKLNDQVRSIVQHRGAAGVFGFLSLIWATIQIFINASVAMNAMWEVKESRNWFYVRGLALFLMFVTGCLIAFSLVLSGAPTAIAEYNLPIINHLPTPMRVVTVLFEGIALLINCVMYVAIYKLLPNAKVSWSAAIIGGVTASLLFEVAKKGIASYLLRANHSVYGDLANLILFVLWIYYSMTILLLGAEVSAAVARLKGETQSPGIGSKTGLGRPTLGERIHRSSRAIK